MNKRVFILMMVLALLMVAGSAFAITAPTDPNSFGYLFYDYVVVKGLQGAIGFVAGLCIVVWGASMLPAGKYIPALITIVSGGVILSADKIVTGFGMLI
ncbi:hypothetical protein [Geothermobacter hydrogeniphilus]|uniref:Uncharacterized protein n=1 Tax=Geothermobacter hydrogeniphilus TaxID=1969733 RepID=A0A1X0XX53_9BACT|nr:hypothetical protein [Geothermobacter hydrogeniphilus]ORJ57491.1 hypothetical protein B5V00_13660 [Geothermobacter hydrogeniphilus]